MKPLLPGQSVKYVTSRGDTVDGKILEVFSASTAHVEWEGKHLALAHYSEDKMPNTFHLEDGPETPEKLIPFKPGTKAAPDTPKPPGADAPSPVA